MEKEKDESAKSSKNEEKNPYWDSTASKKPLILYFIITYMITWSCWIIGMQYLLGNGHKIPNSMNFQTRMESGYENIPHMIFSYIFALGTIGPMISAFIVTLYYYKLEGLKELLRRMFIFRVSLKWYIIIVFIPLIISFVGLLSTFLQGGDVVNGFQFPTPWFMIILMFVSQIFSSGLEEPGWRGFATPEMHKFRNAEDTGYYVGILWAIWHFPFLIYLYIVELNMPGFLVILSLVGYVALTVPMAIILVWVYDNTESVAILIIAHALNNVIPAIIFGEVVDSSNGFVIDIVTWIIAALLTKKYGKETLIWKK